MARGWPRKQQSNGADEGAVEVARVSNRDATIRAAVAWVAAKQAEVAAINAEIRGYKSKHVKYDLGWKIADFNAVLRVAMLEDERRDAFLDVLREGFGALGIGESMDWVKAAQVAEPQPEPEPY